MDPDYKFVLWIKTTCVRAPISTTDKEAGEYIENLDVVWEAMIKAFIDEAKRICPGFEIRRD